MDFLQSVWSIFMELAPWLLLGAGIAGLLHAFLPPGFISRHLGRPGWWTTIKAAIVGVPMPLCSCAVIPTGIGLYRKGASRGASVSFLISTPQTGVDSIAVTAALLGWPFALFKVGAAFLMGMVGGVLADGGKGQSAPADSTSKHSTSVAGKPPGLLSGLHFAVDDLLRMIWLWIVIGILLSAALTTFLEPGSLSPERWMGLKGLWADLLIMLITLVIALPLYVCATASVPIAAAMIVAGFPTGSALVFLMAGPATNIATIGAIGRGLGWRTAGIYLATVIIGSVGLGLLYEALFGLQAGTEGHHHGHGGAWWQIVSALIVALLFLRFAIRDLKALFIRKPAEKSCCAGPTQLSKPSCCAGNKVDEPAKATGSGGIKILDANPTGFGVMAAPPPPAMKKPPAD